MLHRALYIYGDLEGLLEVIYGVSIAQHDEGTDSKIHLVGG